MVKLDMYGKGYGMRSAFTMVEAVFVIVILGILAAIAIPKLAVTRDDAVIVKGRANIAAIRSGIALQKSQNMLQGDSTPYPGGLDAAGDANVNQLFYHNDGNSSNILENPIYSDAIKDGGWVMVTTGTVYDFNCNGALERFTYVPATGSFDCVHTNDNCKSLTE